MKDNTKDNTSIPISLDDEHRDQLLIEVLVRISLLEKLLVARNLLTQEEISNSFKEIIDTVVTPRGTN